MTFKIAINGYGRIGRNILRAFYESNAYQDLKIVAINDLGKNEINAYLTQYDSVHGAFKGEVKATEQGLVVNGDEIKVCSERDPKNLPWEALGIDAVLECTGFFTSREAASHHLQAGARKVLISAPAGNDLPTIVFGVNHQILKPRDTLVSNASCTTNCLAPLAKVLNDHFKIEAGSMVTIHSYTNDQRLTDSYHSDIRRARAATQSMIPTKTGAASAVGLVLPELKGRLDGYAIRVPTINVSLVDFTFTLQKEASVAEINQVMKQASEQELKGVLAYNEAPLVSIDFNHNPHSSIFDATETQKTQKLYKVVAWYDNEWGFSNRMLDTVKAMLQAK